MTTESEVVTDDGHRLWTATSGRGEPVVLCHGGPGLWDMFGALTGLLAGFRTVHRWDQRGCGRSQPGGPYSIARSVADLDAVRRHFGHDRIAVLGHSWGAQLALRYALDHPGRVSKLVYLSGTGVADGWQPEHRRAAADRLRDDLPRIRELEGRARTDAEERELAVLTWTADFADPARARVRAEALATPWLGINRECSRTIDDELASTMREADLVAACRRLPVPTLILDGAQDNRPRWAVDSLAAALPVVTRLTLPGIGHLPWIEAPEATADALRSFLAAA